MINFSDIFKSSFLEKAASFSLTDSLIAIAFAFAVGLFIYLVYKKTFSGVMYSASFGVSLIAMSTITTLVILAVTSNVVLSLGMVGALSIVRFRTAIKEPMDIAFLFWSIAVGIIMGAGLIPLAVIGSVIIGIILLVFANIKVKDTPYMLLVDCASGECEQKIFDVIKSGAKKYLLKSKSISDAGAELTVEVRLQGEDTAFLKPKGPAATDTVSG